MKPIRSIAEIPFRERDPYDLLHLDQAREVPDEDNVGFGHGRLDTVLLDSQGRDEPIQLHGALLLALHSADQGEELDDDIELEFFVPEVAPDYSVTVLLSEFLARWLPQVSGGERAIVLVLCNPYRAVLPRPAAAGATPVYYALGDVESWLEGEGSQELVQLVADEWRRAE